MTGRDTQDAPANNTRRSVPASARTGAEGEDAAVRFLQHKGWKVLARNWRFRHLELDIVA
ncbi:MAG: YraN family protein, partial [Mailhella sp.]|nr:YraN family protein [Mailhella sp.]